MMTNDRIDWSGLMKTALSELRLMPEQFWSLTPAELMAMLGRDFGASPMTRSRLELLMNAFPDARPASLGAVARGETDV